MNKVRTGEEALRVFNYLGIKDVTKDWQKKKGTQVFELPFKTMYYNGHSEVNRFTIYKNGYIRKMVVNENNASRSCWQLNRVRKVASFVKDLNYNDSTNDFTWTGKYRKIYNRERIMVDGHKHRLVYLCNYLLKNYYNNSKYALVGDYTAKKVSEVHRKWWKNETKNDKWPFEDTKNCIDVDYEPKEVEIIIDGHRYKVI